MKNYCVVSRQGDALGKSLHVLKIYFDSYFNLATKKIGDAFQDVIVLRKGADEKTKEISEPFYNNYILMHDMILM